MKHPARTAGLLAAVIYSGLAASSQPGYAVIAAYDRNAPSQTYTFHMSVAVAMKHFPWLHFHMDGDGLYRPGDRYKVHFTSGPPMMPQGARDIDLSMLDPSMWPGRYRYEAVGQDRNGDTIFSLEDASSTQLQKGTVALDPLTGTRWVDATYQDGTHIHMDVTCDNALGFIVPESLKATVDYPHMPVVADATFSDYSLQH